MITATPTVRTSSTTRPKKPPSSSGAGVRRPTTVRPTPAPQAPAAERQPSARWPFALVIALLAGGGLIALLMLNTATAQSSFTKSKLQQDLSSLTDQEQALQQEVSKEESPEELAKKAAALGMAPGPQPGYLVLNPDGTATVVDSSGGPSVPVPPPPASAPTSPSPSVPVGGA